MGDDTRRVATLVDPAHAAHVVAASRRERSDLGAAWVDGTPLGNGRVGAVVWGTQTLTLTVDHAEFWDRRSEGSPPTPHPFTDFLAALDGTPSAWPAQWPVHMPRFDIVAPTRLPPSRIRLHGLGAVTSVVHHLDTAGLEVTTATGACRVRVLAGADVVLVDGVGPVPDLEVHWLSEPANWEQRVGGQPGLAPHPTALFADYEDALRTASPTGGSIVQAVPGSGAVAMAWTRRGDTDRWLVAAALAADRTATPTTVVDTATALCDAVLDDHEQLVDAHERHWAEYHARSWVSVPESEVQALWFAEITKLGAALRADGPPLGLQGPWSPDGRMPPWGGDLHHNVNVQLSYAPVHVTNHGELAESLHRFVRNALPVWRDLCAALFGIEGLFVPSATDDDGRCRYEWAMVNLALSSGPWLAHVVHSAWLHSGDVALRDEVVVPLMEGVAAPLTTLLTEGPDGRLHLPRCYSPELVPAGGAAWGPDATIDLALLRWLFDALADVLDEGGRDGAGWRDRASRLASLPTDAGTGVIGSVLTGRGGGLRVRTDVSLDRSHRHHSHLLPIHPLRQMTAHSADARTRQVVDASVDNLMLAGSGEWVGFSVPWASSIAAHAGRPDVALGYLRDYAERWVGPSTFHVQCSARGLAPTVWNQLGAAMGGDALSLEAGFAFVAAVCDLLVQDHDGVVRLAPAVPEAWGDVAFAGLRAAGGWEVSARIVDRVVVAARVLAHREGELVLRCPGPTGIAEWRRRLRAGEEFAHTAPGWTVGDIRPPR